MTVFPIDFSSVNFHNALLVRDEVLRKPLNMIFNPEDISQEYDSHHLVCEEFSEIVGVLVLKPLSKHLVKMRQVAVKPDFQGRGVGSKMVHYAELYAKSKGYREVVLNARDVALDFYKRLNYSVEGEMFVEVGIPHYKMIKKL